MIRRCFISSAKKVGMYVAGVFFDGIAKESHLIFQELPRHIRDRMVTLYGRDPPHQLKAGRNRIAVGSTPPVEAGNLVATMTPFSYTDIDIGAIQVKDQFSDHKSHSFLRSCRSSL